MKKFTLLPSVNWNVSHMMTVNDAGTVCAYGSRGDIIVIKNADADHVSDLGNKIINHAHKNARVMGLVFVKHEIAGKVTESIASCGDDGRIKIWDYENLYATHKSILKENTAPLKLVDIDYFPKSNCIVSIAEQGFVVKWDLKQNKVWTYAVPGKIQPHCLAACPHAEDLVAIGTKFGRVLVFSIKGEGKLIHKLLCHSTDVTSVSWCPVPYNVLQLSKLNNKNFNEDEFKKTDNTFLLASCCSDSTIYISKAGTDNHCETIVKLPPKPVASNKYIPKRNLGHNMERGRSLKWIYPLVMVTYTNFNEMVIVYLTKFDKTNAAQEKKSPQSERGTPMKFDVKPLHNAHKRNISSFAICLFNRDEIDFRIWSYSSDRVIVRGGCRNQQTEKPMVLPQLSGFIFCLDISLVNPDLLAIGTGDGKISVWNISYENIVDIKTLSKKIDHKVMSLSWHPEYEGVFAFGTYEGRVGLFDVSQGSDTPSLFKTFYQKAVYRLCWAPPIYVDDSGENGSKSNELCLLAVVDGDILQYVPKRLDELPVSITQTVLMKCDKKCDACIGSPEKLCSCKNKSDFCYQAGRDVFVVGYKNGEVRVFSASSHQLLHSMTDQTKAIMSITWHPKVVIDSPSEVSSCSNWLAVAGEKVLVYEVKADIVPKKIATLEVHTVRVLSVAWSPHINGRLLSCSGDNTAIVWDVLTQTIIGRYTEHCAQVFCGIWSCLNRDMAITGSSDFTCRMWSVSKDTVSTPKETKKNPVAIEPIVVSYSKTTETIEKPPPKQQKNQTLFSLIAHEFHDSLLLDQLFEETIGQHNPDTSKVANGRCRKHNLSLLNDSLVSIDDSLVSDDQARGQGDAPLTENSSNQKKRQPRKSFQQEFNYGDLFGTDDQLTKLIIQEENALEELGSRNMFVLSQTRDQLKEKITEAMKKNQVDEYHLALAASISTEFWKEACHVYVEQMVRADLIFEAVNFQLAMGKYDEAVELLTDKKRYREAFAIARLRLRDESVAREVLEKWIKFCYSNGSYRLAAHCYMYLKEEEKASITLSKSKIAKDAFLASKLLKYYQPERALELATDCFKRNLISGSIQNVEEILIEFPELRFMEPWYLTLKYLTERKPDTASVTKWVIGFPEDNSPCSVADAIDYESADFEKLLSVIVDNKFQMTYDQLNVYGSAQAALYFVGISKPNFEAAAIRHFIRALSLCYNFRVVNSNQRNSEKAFPLARLLKIWFPKGAQEPKNDIVYSEEIASLRKSVNAYYCDFIITWLSACDELPKSLKSYDSATSSNCNTPANSTAETIVNEGEDVLSELANLNVSVEDIDDRAYRDSLDLVIDSHAKMRKVMELCTQFLGDVLDPDTVKYFMNVSMLKQYDLDGGISQGERNGLHSNADSGIKNRFEDAKKVALSELVYDQEPDTMKPEKKNVSTEHAKELREEVEKFERERVSAPNPFMFICILRELLAKHKEELPTLTNEVDAMLVSIVKQLEIK